MNKSFYRLKNIANQKSIYSSVRLRIYLFIIFIYLLTGQVHRTNLLHVPTVKDPFWQVVEIVVVQEQFRQIKTF